MKIAGITRIRNEEKIINDTLNHFADFCNAGIYVFDDESADRTADIAKGHPAVKQVHINEKWDNDRTRAEYTTRQFILELAQKDNPDWICYFDADERLDIDFRIAKYIMRSPDWNAIAVRLFDAYITESDMVCAYGCDDCKTCGHGYKTSSEWNERKWFGPEYRVIPFFFRNMPGLKYQFRDQRIATYRGGCYQIGACKHYGKAISIDQWEQTCDYYIQNFPEPYKTKWQARKGKAVHTKSDFGNDLITWDEIHAKGIPLDETNC